MKFFYEGHHDFPNMNRITSNYELKYNNDLKILESSSNVYTRVPT